jgi:hypothetical protein
MPTQYHIDNTHQAIAAAALLLCMLTPAWASNSDMSPARAGPDIGAADTAATHLRISDLVMKEKKSRELELQRKLPMSALPVPVHQPKASESANMQRLTTRPVLWSLTGTKGNYQAEIVWQNRLHLISSDQATVPLLGTLEYMDETGVYIRPGRKQRVNKAWLDAEGLLVLPSPRDGQAAPILVEIPTNTPLGRPALLNAAHLPNTVPVSLPAKPLPSQPAPWILASGEAISGNVDLSPPKKVDLQPPMSAPAAAAALPLKSPTAGQNSSK